ncbi:Hpt domain-containing protein [Lentzea nigeriaca]|uniref:Hpt domain-containing protein n=1 Tax=Lentzea nigeriaca TaxID=1128665 RepID=UPI00195DA040|nr:Hpt domain-containing protein [Lentzea nigeriaca]MBM7865108.1 HPt (histidine-containing phosphotransfer) domain-containing protein [Lentzea nigeriaca]
MTISDENLRSAIAERLAQLRFGRPAEPGDLAARVLSAFHTAAPRHIDAIAAAVAAGDAKTAREQAHDLTSLAGHIGAVDVVNSCGELSLRLKAGDIAGAESVVAELRTGYERASHATAGM